MLLAAMALAQESGEELRWAVASLDELSHNQAERKCADLDHEGHGDWRLPTIEELIFERPSIPSELRASLESSGVDAWACNRTETARQDEEGKRECR